MPRLQPRGLLPRISVPSRSSCASERGEGKIFAHWWTSWFDEPTQICFADERVSMPYLLYTAVEKLRR
jgi:hypothetical protein